MAFLDPNPISFSESLEISNVQVTALNTFQSEILRGLSAGVMDPARHSEFIGLQREEILDRFDVYRQESEYHAILTLLAQLEAIIKSDFLLRQNQLPFNVLYHRWGIQPPFEDLLDYWKKTSPAYRDDFGDFKSARRLRHWLAHGRDYKVKLAKIYTPNDINGIVQKVYSAISALPITRSYSKLWSRLHGIRLWLRHWRPFQRI